MSCVLAMSRSLALPFSRPRYSFIVGTQAFQFYRLVDFKFCEILCLPCYSVHAVIIVTTPILELLYCTVTMYACRDYL